MDLKLVKNIGSTKIPKGTMILSHHIPCVFDIGPDGAMVMRYSKQEAERVLKNSVMLVNIGEGEVSVKNPGAPIGRRYILNGEDETE